MTPVEREQMILEWLPMVRAVAIRIHHTLPKSVQLDDLLSAGAVGLIDAVDRFDLKQKVPFGAYARFRIRGEILDSLRGLDLAGRHHRQEIKRIKETERILSQSLKRAPSKDEVAAELGISREDLDRQSATPIMRSLDGHPPEGDTGWLDYKDSLASGEDTGASAEAHERTRMLSAAMQQLPEKWRQVVELHLEGLTLREIGRRFGNNESRMSQIQASAIKQLRVSLAGVQ
jgi:RNA polymerase sigma factor for flagellar operon FliA